MQHLLFISILLVYTYYGDVVQRVVFA